MLNFAKNLYIFIVHTPQGHVHQNIKTNSSMSKTLVVLQKNTQLKIQEQTIHITKI